MTPSCCLGRRARVVHPILIGGNGPKKTLPLVRAKYADEWNAVYTSTLASYKERRALC